MCVLCLLALVMCLHVCTLTTPLPGFEISSVEENKMVATSVDALQDSWNSLTELLEEKDAQLQVTLLDHVFIFHTYFRLFIIIFRLY